MNNRDWTLLLVKGFGLYLLTMALPSIPTLIACIYFMVSLSSSETHTAIAEHLRVEQVSQTITAATRLVIYGCSGLFLLRDGALKWLQIEPSPAMNNSSSECNQSDSV